jgi:hypothetical protein
VLETILLYDYHYAHTYYAVTCDLPTQLLNDLQVVTVANGSQDKPHIEGQFITYTCPPGFVLTGPNTSVCSGNGEWEPDPGHVTCIGDCMTVCTMILSDAIIIIIHALRGQKSQICDKTGCQLVHNYNIINIVDSNF